ncbi:MAG: hypothetical protein GY867_01920 [bacterium]|nr:hypothetical protein [bacterium]
MEHHVKPLGILYIVFGAMGVVAALVMLLIFVVGSSALATEDPEASGVVAIVGLVFTVFLLVISLPNVIAGYGLLKYRSWARILTLILSFLNLPAFPLGTGLGVYGIIVLFDDNVKMRFHPQYRTQPPPGGPPTP